MKPFLQRNKYFFLLGLVFLFRLWYGLSKFDEDIKQIYLIGLKFYITGAWPSFGPDVDYASGLFIQLPGALQGLLVGLPFYVLQIPEAPFILVNILSFLSLCLLAWYCTKRVPEVPAWIIWGWILTAPWTLNFSTTVNNLSFALVGSIIFFIGAFETYPFTSRRLIGPRPANFMMGFTLVWVMQLHFSWIILLPFAIASILFQLKSFLPSQYAAPRKSSITPPAFFAFGAILPAILLLPTFFRYGLSSGTGNTERALKFNLDNLLSYYNLVEGILGKFLSYASFEMVYFIRGAAPRYSLLREYPWIIPLVLFLGAVGLFQAATLLFLWFRKTHPQRDWKAIKYVTLATVVLIYVSFLFTYKEPRSHTFCIVLPVAMLYGFYCWGAYLKRRRWQIFAAIILVCGMMFHIVRGVDNYTRESLYLNREQLKSALVNKEHRIFKERRAGTIY